MAGRRHVVKPGETLLTRLPSRLTCVSTPGDAAQQHQERRSIQNGHPACAAGDPARGSAASGRGTYRFKPVKPLGDRRTQWHLVRRLMDLTTSPRRPCGSGPASWCACAPATAAASPGQPAVNKAASTHVCGPAETLSGMPSSMAVPVTQGGVASTPSPAPTKVERAPAWPCRSPAARRNLLQPTRHSQATRPKPANPAPARNHRPPPQPLPPPPPSNHTQQLSLARRGGPPDCRTYGPIQWDFNHLQAPGAASRVRV